MAKFSDDPFLDWLLKHLLVDHLVDHHIDPDDLTSRDSSYVEGFHDGCHKLVDDTSSHDGFQDAWCRHVAWLAAATASKVPAPLPGQTTIEDFPPES